MERNRIQANAGGRPEASMNRRGFLTGLIAAPAVILTPGLLMPVRAQRILHPVWGPHLYQVNFYKNGLWIGGTNPSEPLFGPGHTFNLDEPVSFKAGDIFGIELGDLIQIGAA
jgi:hypothetical protein